jgi:hypothetical protein
LTVWSKTAQHNPVNTVGFAGSNVVQHHLHGSRMGIISTGVSAAAAEAKLLQSHTKISIEPCRQADLPNEDNQV